MFLKRSEESYGNVRLNGEKVDFDSLEWDYLLYQLGKMGVCLIKYVYTINEILINKMNINRKNQYILIYYDKYLERLR